MDSRSIVMRLFHAVENRDIDAVVDSFTADAIFCHVPNEPEDIRTLFAPMMRRAERIEWVISRELYGEDFGIVERADRYWIDGIEYCIEATGVFEVDLELGRIHEMREYMDLALWKSRLGDVLRPLDSASA